MRPNETGVQPYIVFKDYDSSLMNDTQKANYAADWYDENINDEGTFLFMYFAEQDVDNEVGYMHCIVGNQVAAIMDSEAQDIFWDYVDTYWHSDLSTDDMTVMIFDKTADRIMTKTSNAFDVGKMIVLVGGAIVIITVLRKMQKAKHQRQREKAAEDERILNTPLNTDVTDSTLERYK